MEFQIRTADMHQLMNTVWQPIGSIKNLEKLAEQDEQVFGWLRQFVEWRKDLMITASLWIRLNGLFHDVVFVFTQQAEVRKSLSGPLH